MNDSNRPSGRDPQDLPAAASATDLHASHDTLLVAAFATDALDGPELVSAERLVATCQDCARLLADVRAIASATATLPAVPRQRDFRLSADDAARLRPNGWRRFVVAFAGARFAVTRPLAIGLTTLGIAGLVISAAPGIGGFERAGSGPAGDAASAPEFFTNGPKVGAAGGQSHASIAPPVAFLASPAASAAQAPAPSSEASAAASDAAASFIPNPSAAGTNPAAASATPSAGPSQPPSPASKNDNGPSSPTGLTAGGQTGDGSGDGVNPPAADGSGRFSTDQPEVVSGGSTQGPAPLLVVSLIFLAVGIGLVVARSVARRVSQI